MKVRWHELLALFLAACASLLFEITLTRIFEFSVWSNYAFLVVSTAMFGLGLAGIVLTRRPEMLASNRAAFLVRNSLGMGVATLFAFLVVNSIPVHLPDAPLGWPQEFLNLGAVFMAISLPFFFFGLMMSFLFEKSGEHANIYYFADLMGAGLGSFLLVPLIPVCQPQGLVLVCALLALAAAALFSLGWAARRRWVAIPVLGVLAAAAVAAAWAPRFAARIPLNVHADKRYFKKDLAQGRIEASGWSALSRVDIASFTPQFKKVWIAGGVNESLIKRFNGDFQALRNRRREALHRAAENINYDVLPHLSKIGHTVCVIGTSGGADSLLALECGARKVTGVELDPTIAAFVTEKYSKWAGGLFTDGDYSELIVDEGRSYLRRSGRKFDVIEQINNATPIAFAKGALNLSENYLLTLESFLEMYDHLNDDGILYISRGNIIRVLTTAVEMFRRLGVPPEEYSKHLVLCRGTRKKNYGLMMKKSAFTPEEIDRVYDFFEVRGATRNILYAPYRDKGDGVQGNNLYYQIATSPDPRPYWRVGPFNFSPPTDAKPFFNHITLFGRRDDNLDDYPLLPSEIRSSDPGNRIFHRVPKGDLPVVIILFEAALLASIFFGVPLLSSGRMRASLRANLRVLGYFAALGMAFIFVEICLIQRLVLFLGTPVYSIATVFGSLLLFAGIGSLVSGRLTPQLKTVRLLLGTVAGAILLTHFLMPLLTRVFLGTSFPVRVTVAVCVTGILGFLMGMPMPTGIRFLKAARRDVVSWAWAVNGYFTIIGSALSVLIAINLGFLIVFLLAAAIYASAPLFLGRE